MLLIGCMMVLSFTADADSAVQPGDLVAFGTYEQDGVYNNGKEDVLWIVLEVENDCAMLLSLYTLDCHAYHDSAELITWESCALRAWLNNEMLNELFSPDEQAAILVTDVDNSSAQGRKEWSGVGGENTQDRLYLLSYQEALHYLGNDVNTLSLATTQAMQNGVFNCKGFIDRVVHFGAWWLRSPGRGNAFAASVGCYGGVGKYTEVTNKYYGVRPVLWVNLNEFP